MKGAGTGGAGAGRTGGVGLTPKVEVWAVRGAGAGRATVGAEGAEGS